MKRPLTPDGLGRALIKLGQLEEAEAYLLRARQLGPRSVTAHQNLAEVFRKQGRYAEAVASYEAVLEIDAGYPLAYAGMGMALFEARRYAEALPAMKRAVALAPALPTAATLHLYMGRAAREVGQLEAAAQHLRRAMEIEPGNLEFLFELAKVRALQQRYEETDQLLQRARQLRPRDPATLHNVAEALRNQGRYEEAVATYRAALEIDPELAPAHAGAGIALFQWEHYEEAVGALEQAIALQPEFTVVGSSLHVFLGRALQELGRPEAAAEHYTRAVQAAPRDREALDRLAMSRFGQQRYEEALDLYRRVVEIKPGSAQAQSNLGATLYHLGRFDEARRSIERALALDPSLETARIGLEQVRKALQQDGQ